MTRTRLRALSGLIGLTAALGTGAAIAVPAAASGAVLNGGSAVPSLAALGKTAHQLSGVSCPAVKECVAVGSNQYSNDGRGGPLAATWNGKAWKGTTLALPAGGVSGALFAVSCPTTKKCVAVGQYSGGLLVESWNGKAWTPAGLPALKGDARDNLTGVSCATATSCVAVGIAAGASDSLPLAATWNGSAWTVSHVVSVSIGSLFSNFNAVSCPSAKSCMAVGSANGAVLTASWNGTSWKPLPKPAGFSLTGVSCVSASDCVVTGNTADIAAGVAKVAGFADKWNGSKWSALPLPWPKSGNSYLASVSCPKAGSCAAAGSGDLNPRALPQTCKAAVANWNG